MPGRSARPGTRPSQRVEANAAEEKARRANTYHAELRLLWVFIALSLPLLVEMLSMFGQAHSELLPRWLQLALALQLLANHTKVCVRSAIRSGNGEAVIDELMAAVKRFGRQCANSHAIVTSSGRN